jgi:hypothetical protein
MLFVALGVLALAALVALGRRPLLARQPGRLAMYALAALAIVAAGFDALRGGWIGGSILASAGLWLFTSASRPVRRQAAAPASAGMDRAQAASMLGVGVGAGRDEIEAAYRRLMLRVHPDKGGAPGLAAQLNAARDALLKS